MKILRKIKLGLLTCLTIAISSCSNDDDGNNNGGGTTETKQVYVTNNNNGNITIYDVSNLTNVTSKTLVTTSLAADGIYYDGTNDIVSYASRTNNSIESFADVSLSTDGATIAVSASSTADMTSPREMVVNGNFYVVVDNSDADGDTNTPDGRFYIYQKSGSSFTLRNVVTTNFKVWSGVFIGNDFYAIVDTTNQLAVFNNFLSANTTNATVMADKTIAIEGIVRTHGMAFDSADINTMILTDIGSAADNADGGFHVITNFITKFNATADGGTLALSDQTRVSGASTQLGNPVDVSYDGATQTVIVAEAANGKVLVFNNIGTGGNLTPTLSYDMASASSVYLHKE